MKRDRPGAKGERPKPSTPGTDTLTTGDNSTHHEKVDLTWWLPLCVRYADGEAPTLLWGRVRVGASIRIGLGYEGPQARSRHNCVYMVYPFTTQRS